MEKRITEKGEEPNANVKSTYDILGEGVSSTIEAEALLQSLCSSLRGRDFDLMMLPNMMRTYLLALRLLGIDDEWPTKELKGYTSKAEVPSYRDIYCDTTYYGAESDNKLEKMREGWQIIDGLFF